MQLTLFFSVDIDKERVIHLKGNDIEFMSHDKTDEFVEEPIESLFPRYQAGLGISIKGSNFIFDCLSLLYCKRNKINLDCSGSYINSLD